MAYLSNRYRATLHNPDLSLEDTTTENAHQPITDAKEAKKLSKALDSTYNALTMTNENDVETRTDEIVELVVKSNSTVIAENCAEAEAAGKVISLTTATTSQTTSTSIRSTFDSISNSVSVMRSSTKRKEREVTVQATSAMVSYQGTRMVLTKDSENNKVFAMPPGEAPNERRVQISMHPFAQGKPTELI